MDSEGPLLEQLTRRLAECPGEFLAEAAIAGRGTVNVAAVVADVLCDLGGERLSPADAGPFRSGAENQRNRLQTILVACGLLADAWFRTGQYAAQARTWLTSGLDELARLIPAERLVLDADRREELARLCLRALGLRPAGETVAQAEDRLTTLHSVERQRVLRDIKAAEQRAESLNPVIYPDPGTLASSPHAEVGQSYQFEVIGNTTGPLWGTDVYTHDSNLGTAAVHAGVLQPGERGVVRVTLLDTADGRIPFVGTARNGVHSQSWGAWNRGFKIVRGP